MRSQGTLGFQGQNPCGQKAGQRKVFEYLDQPHNILTSGSYNKIRMMSGANKDEGTLIWGAGRGAINNTLFEDEDFLKYDLINLLLQAVEMKGGFDFTDLIQDEYFRPEDMGDIDAMQNGIIDVLI